MIFFAKLIIIINKRIYYFSWTRKKPILYWKPIQVTWMSFQYNIDSLSTRFFWIEKNILYSNAIKVFFKYTCGKTGHFIWIISLFEFLFPEYETSNIKHIKLLFINLYLTLSEFVSGTKWTSKWPPDTGPKGVGARSRSADL